MLKTSVAVKLRTSPEEVWEHLRAFGNIAEWHPGVEGCQTEGDGVGAFRILLFTDGTTGRELLERHGGGSYTYVAVETALAISSWRSTLAVHTADPDDNGVQTCVVQWWGELDAQGIADGEAILQAQSFYQVGLDYLQHVFGASS